MRYGVRVERYKLSCAQQSLAESVGISEDFLRLLLARGIAEKDIEGFLRPSLKNLSSPFHIADMDKAAERINLAVKRNEKILIFGDYDCDGICAASILMLYLKDKADVGFFIPDRLKHGYGMTLDSLESILKTRRPDLIISVDCGITSVKEVEFLKSQGIDVIVTDHHEPQAELPNCIVVDAKIDKVGFCDYCGAGVALRLIEAMGGEAEARKYLDVAAIATIADVVPLVGDNRIIAYYGLKALAENPRKGIKLLMGEDKINSQSVMFKLAPRMNAAGRLDSASKVLSLFLEDDHFILKSLSEELMRDNAKRQEICESVVREAKNMLKGADFCKLRFIALYDKAWEPGVLGIAAARIAEDFNRPTALFSNRDGELRGSARSIKSVNVFELFCGMSEYFSSFGGHAQAAGLALREENFDSFRIAANEALLRRPANDFYRQTLCDSELDVSSDVLNLAKELELLEPTGYGNPRPNFLLRGNNLKFENIGFSNHIKCCAPNADILGFSRYGACVSGFLGETELEVTLGVNVFQNNVRAQCIMQSFNPVKPKTALADSQTACLHHLRCEGEATLKAIDKDGIASLLEKPYGTLIVCFCSDEYYNITDEVPQAASLPVAIGVMRYSCPENFVIISPAEDFDFSYYSTVVIAGKAFSKGYLKRISQESASCLCFKDCTPQAPNIADEKFRALFRELRAFAAKSPKVPSLGKLYGAVRSKINVTESEFSIIIAVFEELGLVSFTDKGIINISNTRTELSKSAVYRNILHG